MKRLLVACVYITNTFLVKNHSRVLSGDVTFLTVRRCTSISIRQIAMPSDVFCRPKITRSPLFPWMFCWTDYENKNIYIYKQKNTHTATPIAWALIDVGHWAVVDAVFIALQPDPNCIRLLHKWNFNFFFLLLEGTIDSIHRINMGFPRR